MAAPARASANSASFSSTEPMRESSAMAPLSGFRAPLVAGERLARLMGAGSEGLGVLGARQLLLELLELPFAGIDLVDALLGEARLLDARALGAGRRLDALELARGGAGGPERGAVGIERLRHRGARPGVHHLHMRGGIEQPLVLVLAAEVHRGRHALGELAHARQRAVQADAAAAVARDPPRHHQALGVARVERRGAPQRARRPPPRAPGSGRPARPEGASGRRAGPSCRHPSRR